MTVAVFHFYVQLYCFEDRGNRRVALRPELTPSLARLVIQKGYEELLFHLILLLIFLLISKIDILYWKKYLGIYLSILVLVLYPGTYSSIWSFFFLVQKIFIPPIEVVCHWSVLEVWENDKGPPPWALSMEYGYTWFTWSYRMCCQLDMLYELLSFCRCYFSLPIGWAWPFI